MGEVRKRAWAMQDRDDTVHHSSEGMCEVFASFHEELYKAEQEQMARAFTTTANVMVTSMELAPGKIPMVTTPPPTKSPALGKDVSVLCKCSSVIAC